MKSLPVVGRDAWVAASKNERAQIDLFNMFNGNSVILQNPRVGPAYRTPTLVMPARMLKFGAQLEF